MIRHTAALLAFTVLTVAGQPAAAAEPLTVTRQPVEDLKAVFATVESVRQIKARARIGGTLSGLSVREGDRVAEGQVIATVGDPKLTLQIAALDARLRSLQAQETLAEAELGRARQLRASGTGSQQRLDDAVAALDVLRAQAAAMRADRAVVEQQMQEGDVLSPADGRVLQVPLLDGVVVMAGEAVATIAAESYVLRLRLPERHARFMRTGDPVLVGARGLAPTDAAQPPARGTIRRVYPELEQGQVVADAEVTGLGDYFVGERVRVLVATGTRDTVVVPADFLVRRLGVDLLRLADGREVPVQAGRPMPTLDGRPGGVEILSGLKPGDRIIRPGDAE
ncbi:efflux RND transporter periplasmic adaptor subunit [Azospirillum sp. RWY-5-1]|uniref:Efflux RND transporter periplasmic adaptor subunit n=1 Tax=Azospirillum oleiclasticum TaxID=2735135 RepID=A0ABX2TIT8_9PROT|nr:efflux RND transporter periplasmic adaptor subunit [Azospirillum oleiclasticum]NYZ16477.1 efflux RND transporter periplasmic adaptor subunit [Azospirillum oleiclasticum]NYZ24054.1 efflux RND transporter periplasmic adaptor subunit [Azospirillum oleiclasticum]